VEEEQAVHKVFGAEIELQLKNDSHPFLASISLSNFALVQVEMAVQTEDDEHAVQVVSVTAEIALQSNEDSQPLVEMESLSNFSSRQVKAVHVEEDVHAVHVAPGTDTVLHAVQHSEELSHDAHDVLAALAKKPLLHMTLPPFAPVLSPHVLGLQHSLPSVRQEEHVVEVGFVAYVEPHATLPPFAPVLSPHVLGRQQSVPSSSHVEQDVPVGLATK